MNQPPLFDDLPDGQPTLEARRKEVRRLRQERVRRTKDLAKAEKDIDRHERESMITSANDKPYVARLRLMNEIARIDDEIRRLELEIMGDWRPRSLKEG